MSERTPGQKQALAVRIFVAALVAAYPVAHKPVSDVFDAISGHFGWGLYNRRILWVLAGACVASAAALLAAWRRRPSARELAMIGILSVASLASRKLMVANVESIHFLQFGLIAGLLIVGRIGPELAWLLAVVTGIWDEVYQHVVVYQGRQGTYLDFNDMLLDAIGAAWAVLLVPPVLWRGGTLAARASGRSVWRHWPVAIATAAIAAGIALPVLPRPLVRRALSGARYHVASLPEAIALALLLGLALRGLLGWRRDRAPGP